MPTTRVFRSSDSGAPVITSATVGSLLAALRACLVGTAGIAYGSKPSAGWTELFTGTNVAAFQSSTADGGTGCVVRVADTAVGGKGAGTINTYASMTDVNTGDSGTATKYIWRAPAGHDTYAASWIIVADEHTWYMSAQQGSSMTDRYIMMAGAGDTESLTAGDAYRYMGMGHAGAFDDYTSIIGTGNSGSYAGLFSTLDSGISMGREYTGLGGAVGVGIIGPSNVTRIGGVQNPTRPAPNTLTEAMMPAFVARGSIIRARLRGVFTPLANITALAVGATVSGVVSPASELAILQLGYQSGDYSGGLWVETAQSW